jgi:hypothetical protein
MRSPGAYDKPPGKNRIEFNGAVYEKGDKVRLKPDEDGADIADSLLKGKVATIETIYLDYEDQAHLAVTIDEDPARDMKQDMGLYMYYKPAEVELVE